jgi:hypothetical protein
MMTKSSIHGRDVDLSLRHHVQPGRWDNPSVLSSEFLSLKLKLPEYEAHPPLLSINEDVSTFIHMYNKQHIKY